MENHWSDDFSLFEALSIAKFVGYEPEDDVWDKSEYVLGLACHIINHPNATLATGHDAVRHFLARARGAAWRA